MPTDRETLKKAEAGVAVGIGLTDPIGEVNAVHTRDRDILKTGTENAATNVAETVACTITNKSRLKSAKLLIPTTNVAANGTDYFVLTLYKRTSAGASQTSIASWNTHSSAQGALTLRVPASMSCVTNTDADIAAGSIITYELLKYGSGKALDALSVITLKLEEV